MSVTEGLPSPPPPWKDCIFDDDLVGLRDIVTQHSFDFQQTADMEFHNFQTNCTHVRALTPLGYALYQHEDIPFVRWRGFLM